VQDVFVQLVRKLPEFTYTPGGSFRGWPHALLVHRWRDRTRRPVVGSVPEPIAADPAEALVEAEYHDYLVGQALRLMRADFQENTWRACWECAGRGRPATEAAAELGMSVAAVYSAQARVLRRLREELAGLIG